MLGIWWRHDIWIPKMLKFDYLKNEKRFWREMKAFLLVLQVLSLRHTKQTSKNVADTTFKHSFVALEKHKKPVFTCSVSTMETPEQCVKPVNSQRYRHQNVIDVVLVSLLLTLNKFHRFFWCFHCWIWTSKSRLGNNKTFLQTLLSKNFALYTFTAILFDSVAPLVKIISFASAPMRLATCCKKNYDMRLICH